MRTGEVVTGRVTELRYVPSNSSTRGGRGSANSPVVAFTTRAGEVRSMVGSVNRYKDFDRAFLPTQKHTATRWQRVSRAWYDEVSLPPITCFRAVTVRYAERRRRAPAR